jgi:hypothetical protein
MIGWSSPSCLRMAAIETGSRRGVNVMIVIGSPGAAIMIRKAISVMPKKVGIP